MVNTIIYLIPVAGLIAFLYTFTRSQWINKQDPGSERMISISNNIEKGANAFIKTEYQVLGIFVIIIAFLLILQGVLGSQDYAYLTALSFVVGAVCSGLAGYIGMRVATKANVRTANATRSSLSEGLKVAFTGGSVMGMSVVGLAILGLGLLFILYYHQLDNIHEVLVVLTSFSFGGSSIAFFARVGGGIYTKAADVGADLVGKVEAGIPEDHPLNPATIADNVGDNVGDVAGMGADLFESYVASIISTMILGAAYVGLAGFTSDNLFGGLNAVLLPLVLSAVGILTSIIGTYFVKIKEGGQDPQNALHIGEFTSAGVMILASYFIITWMLPSSWVYNGVTFTATGVFWATLFGLASGLLIGLVTKYFTATDTKPVLSIVRQSVTGSATNIISGIGVGMISTAIPIIIIAAAIMGAHHVAGLYGIAIAAVGMLSNIGMQLSIDAYGPISDNAGGIAEMADLPDVVRQRTDTLDAVGNTTAAVGKGYAIGSAALTALALFVAFVETYNTANPDSIISTIDVTEPRVTAALFVGAMLPYLFSALSIQAVGRAAMRMIEEVRRQFRAIPELSAALGVMRKNEGIPMTEWNKEDQEIFSNASDKPDYEKCVAISTKASIREMLAPGLLAVMVPVLFGFLGGPIMLGGLLAGVTSSGILLALFQVNTGGAWDNAKKMVEEGVEIDGVYHGKGSETHKATVVGDTVGDPFKDTSGPSLNTLIKLMSIVALVIAAMI